MGIEFPQLGDWFFHQNHNLLKVFKRKLATPRCRFVAPAIVEWLCFDQLVALIARKLSLGIT
jgi:hypothetical protein